MFSRHYIKWKNERAAIELHSVSYIEAKNRQVHFHTNNGVIKTMGKLTDYLDVLLANDFVRIHQSFVVNMDRIRFINMDRILLKNGETVFISVRKRSEVMRTYDAYLAERM